MRKNVFSVAGKVLRTSALALFFIATGNQLSAQCGLSTNNEGGTLNPNGTWQSVNVGSGAYVDFNVTQGNIYSFRYTSGTSNQSTPWDMTISSTSAALPYNNSVTPIKDSWTGGSTCAATSRPGSAEWVSAFSGTVRVNTHSFSGGNCRDWVIGQNSATLQYKVCIPATDPGDGISSWSVDAFATTDIAIPNIDARYGSYIEPGLNFVTTNSWPATGNPSTATSWIGCTMPDNNFVIRARRTGFPCGLYQIYVNKSKDNIRIYLNGTQIFDNPCCISSPTQAGNALGYILGPNDKVEIRLSNTCASGEADVSFALQAPQTLDGGIIGGVPNNASICEGAVIGNFANLVSASGGNTTGTLAYSWEISTDGGGTFTTSGPTTDSWNVTDTVPNGGIYVVHRKATDACGASALSNDITVNGRPRPNGGFSPALQTACGAGSEAVLTVNFSDGTGPFAIGFTDGVTNYNRTGINNGDTIHVQPTINTIYGLNYINDSYGCNRTSGFNSGALIQIDPPLNVTAVNFTDITCFGDNNGSISITASGGTAPYAYSIDSGATYMPSSNFNALPAGTYTVMVRDTLGCPGGNGFSPVVITEPAVVSATIAVVNASCKGVVNGSITVTAAGGVPPYGYVLNAGATQQTNVFVNLGSGNYSVVVYDDHGCASPSQQASITNTYAVTLSVTGQTNVSCNDSADGSVTAVFTGGIQPYTYSIDGVNYQSSPTFQNLGPGTYNLFALDSSGCPSQFGTGLVNIVQPDALVISLESVDSVYCYGVPGGAIRITPYGGTPAYNYLWSNGSTLEDAVHILDGTYAVTVTDSKACSATFSTTLTAPPGELVLSVNPVNVKCFQASNGSVTINTAGGTLPYEYSLNGFLQPSNSFSNLDAGDYIATVEDAHNCKAATTFTITEPAAFVVNAGSDQVSLHGQPLDLSGTATSNSGIISYIWSPADFLSCTDCQHTVTTPDSTITYVLMVTDGDSCVEYDSVTVTVKYAGSFLIPTAFTPNGDNLNDYFEMDVLGAKEMEVRIFNRWGEPVYYNAHQANGSTQGNAWNGTKDGKVLPYDTYVYQLKVMYYDNTFENRNGTITLIR